MAGGGGGMNFYGTLAGLTMKHQQNYICFLRTINVLYTYYGIRLLNNYKYNIINTQHNIEIQRSSTNSV